jgi:hypothetical protein
MLYLRAFMSGIAIPTALLPIILCIGLALGKNELLSVPLLHYIPVIWGIWNVLYFLVFRDFLPGREGLKYLITGAILGFILACVGVFWLHVPTIVGFTGEVVYYPLVIVPILYAILWAYGVRPLNKVVGIIS